MNLYHKRFLNSRNSADIMPLFARCKKPHKEITESWAMLEAFKTYVPNFNDWRVLVIGDGIMPRTGILIAYFTKAAVISIDPILDVDGWLRFCEDAEAAGNPVQRLEAYALAAEEYIVPTSKPVCVIWPHSHADMSALKTPDLLRRIDIAMSCCKPIPRNWLRIPHTAYEDENVLSPKREVRIWT